MKNYTKAHKDDVVELIEDLPDYGFKRGQRAVVTEAFDAPGEAYDLEFLDHEGYGLGLAYSVEPHQFVNISRQAFEEGLELYWQGKRLEAERAFRRALELKPSCIDVLTDIFIRRFCAQKKLDQCITALRFVMKLDPGYQTARNNLAVANHLFGRQKAEAGDFNEALNRFHLALLAARDESIKDQIKRSLAATHTTLGIQASSNQNLDGALDHFIEAYHTYPDAVTQKNLGRAYANTAEFYLDRDEFDEAVNRFERAQIAGYVTPAVLNDHGYALAKLGRLEDATREFERGLELAPESEIIQSNLREMLTPPQAHYKRAALKVEYDPLPSAPRQEFAPAA